MHQGSNKFCFTPFPELETERLLLRSLVPEDADEIYFLRSDERILQHLDNPKTQNKEEAISFIEMINKNVKLGESVYWGITLKNKSQIIGTICLWNIQESQDRAEIGYVLHPDLQGKGIMHEALNKVLEYGFQIMKLLKIDAELSPANLKSIRVLEKFNFVLQDNIPDINELRERSETIHYTLYNQST